MPDGTPLKRWNWGKIGFKCEQNLISNRFSLQIVSNTLLILEKMGLLARIQSIFRHNIKLEVTGNRSKIHDSKLNHSKKIYKAILFFLAKTNQTSWQLGSIQFFRVIETIYFLSFVTLACQNRALHRNSTNFSELSFVCAKVVNLWADKSTEWVRIYPIQRL